MRLFYAVDLNDETKDKIEEIMKTLKENSVNGRYVKKEDLHITIKFLGDCDESELEDLKMVADIVLSRMKKFSLEFDRIAYWEKFDKKQMYISLKNTVMLEKIYRKVNTELEKMGYRREKRKFSAHITIGRNMFLSKNSKLEELSKSINKYSFKVDSLSLVNSYKDEQKLMYKNLYMAKMD